MTLSDRMKDYERITNTKLMIRTPVMMRCDGRAFHSFCKDMEKPFDKHFIKLMDITAKYLRENIPDCEIAYVESDEITLCLFPYKTFDTNTFFDGRVQKLASVVASMATYIFNKTLDKWRNYPICDIESLPPDYQERVSERSFADKVENKIATFDCRVWNLPKEEVLNCLLWRQQDSKRNAIMSAGQTWIGKKQIHGFKTTDIIDKLKEIGIDYWSAIPAEYHYGRTFTSLGDGVWKFDDEEHREKLFTLVNCEEE